MIRAVIFDHDGVIADTEPIHFAAVRDVLARFGLKFPEEQRRSFVGKSSRENWKRLQAMLKIPAAVDELAREKIKLAVGIVMEQGIEPSRGLLPLLQLLKKNSCKMAIASGQYRQFIDAVLSKLKIRSYFSAIVSGEDTANGKPHPEVFLTAAKRLGVNPEECLVIEDSESGVTAAKAAGMQCVAVRTQSTASHDVSAADKVVNSLAELKIESIEGAKRKQ